MERSRRERLLSATPLSRRQFAAAVGTVAVAFLGQSHVLATPIPLRVVFADLRPWSFLRADGTLHGLLVQRVTQALLKASVSYETHAYPWIRAQLLVKNNEADAYCTVPNEERSKFVLFCDTPLLVEHISLVHRKSDERLKEAHSLDEINQLRRAADLGSGYAKKVFDQTGLTYLPTAEAGFKMVASGRLDVYVSSSWAAKNSISNLSLAQDLEITEKTFLPSVEYHFGIRSNYPDVRSLIDRIEISIQKMKSDGLLAATPEDIED